MNKDFSGRYKAIQHKSANVKFWEILFQVKGIQANIKCHFIFIKITIYNENIIFIDVYVSSNSNKKQNLLETHRKTDVHHYCETLKYRFSLNRSRKEK